MGGTGHLAGDRRARRDTPSRARFIALGGTICLHLSAIALVMVELHSSMPSGRAAPSRLTLISLPQSQPQPRAPLVEIRLVAPRKRAEAKALSLPPPQAATAVLPSSDPAEPVLSAASASASAQRASVQAELEAYKQQLWRHISARRPRGIAAAGTSLIRFRVSPAGELLSAELVAPSGNPLLDRIALRTLRQASPLPLPPASLSAEALVFTLPVNFH